MLGEIEIILVTLLAAAIAAVSQYIMKSSITTFKFRLREIVGLLWNRGLVMGILLYLVSAVVYLFALSSGQLSFVFPIFASTFVFVLLISMFVLKEKVGAKRILGVCIIVLGIVLVALTY